MSDLKKLKSSGENETTDQLAIFNETFASFNKTIKGLNDSYANLQLRYQKLSDELTATNEKLRESLDQNIRTKTFLEDILESLTSGVLTLDLNGRVTSINKAGCEILKISQTSIINRDYCSLFGATLSGSHSLTELLTGSDSYRNVEKNVTIDKNMVIPISASGSRLSDANGNTIGALEVIVNLTEIKRLEEEIARVKSLAALGEVAAVVAHEVRNPLSGIAGFAALLKQELGEENSNTRYVDKIIAGVEKLNRSVTSLLEYARDMNHEPRPGDLTALITDTVEFFKVDLHTRKSKTQVKTEMPKSAIECNFDPENLTGAIVNLLKNADEAMQYGGEIRVALDRKKENVEISISNEGNSIPEAILDKIFTPFFTTRQGGTGLGLALVKKVVDAHRGRIDVMSQQGKGTTFTIILPARQAKN